MREKIDLLVNFCSYGHTNVTDEIQRRIRAFILVWVSTTLIMWFYVFFSFAVYDFPTVGIGGFIFSFIHTLVPIIYRFRPSLTIAGLIISLTALAFQITFAVFNGGIHSPSAIWFTAHPVIISFFASKRLVLFSVVLNMITVTTLTYLGQQGYFPDNSLSQSLTELMTISSLIGLDIIIATYTLVFIMTTETKQNELEKRNEQIESLMRIIGHDIGNALSVSTLTARSLEKFNHEPKVLKKLGLINKANSQISEITHSIVQWMKANDKSMNLQISKVSLSEIIEYINNCHTENLYHKNIQLNLNYENSSEKVNILADSTALRYQVIYNIISNAIKFSPNDETIEVEIKTNPSFVSISVSDCGQGIPNDLLPDIFDPSKTTSRYGTSGEKGTGFGLPIVKTMLESMKSSISISSTAKEDGYDKSGTTITINIPISKKTS